MAFVQGVFKRIFSWRQTPADNRPPVDALPIGTKIGDDHTVTGYLGSGGFGYTYLARRFDGHEVALKECFPFEYCRRNGLEVGLKTHDAAHELQKIRDGFHDEAAILAEFNHPNIVPGGALITAFNTVYIEMDHVRGQMLSDHLLRWFGRPSNAQCREFGLQILSALDVIHAKGYLHKDISPDNIIIDQTGKPVLIDFGSAAPIGAPKDDEPMLVVKVGYSPQEFYRPKGEMSPAADLYQLGATLRHCITNVRPIESVSRMHARAQGKPDPISPLGRARHGQKLDFHSSIDKSMAVFAKDRIASAREWRKILDAK